MHEKLCNMCGNDCFVYIVVDNAPLCSDCMPVKELKKIPSEAKMLDKMLTFAQG